MAVLAILIFFFNLLWVLCKRKEKTEMNCLPKISLLYAMYLELSNVMIVYCASHFLLGTVELVVWTL